MNNLNSVLLEGNMVKDPLLKTTQKGKSVCNFSIASNRYYKGESSIEEETGFFVIEAWGKMAENCISLGRKGRGVRVVGRLKQDRWTATDGKPRNRIVIIAEHLEYKADFKEKSPGHSPDGRPAGQSPGQAHNRLLNRSLNSGSHAGTQPGTHAGTQSVTYPGTQSGTGDDFEDDTGEEYVTF